MLTSKHHLNSLSLRILYNNIFVKVPMAPPDPIIGVNNAFNSDADPRKVNLGVGAYRDDNSKPYIFKIVRKVEYQIIADSSLNKYYLPIDGSAKFNSACQKLIFGYNSQHLKDERVVTVQTLSGTGSLRVGFYFINQYLPSKVLVSNPTWANHHNIINRAGLKFVYYPYYDHATKKAQIGKWVYFLEKCDYGNIVLMHACAHNPTGVDPTMEEWKVIADVIKRKKLIPYFDSAYQGFASGDILKDIEPVRYFAEQNFSMLVSQSFAKNMGLYGERVGAFHVLTPDKNTAAKVLSQLKMIIRANYSSPPIHGARIAERVLSDATNFAYWNKYLAQVALRIIAMRKALRLRLYQINTPGKWNHITDQIGMFSFTGLNEPQVLKLINKHHIHLVKNGRIAMVGINTKNVDYIAEAIKDVVVNPG